MSGRAALQRYCHRAILWALDYEFNDFIQAVHRIYRFLQQNPVIIDILYMDTESEVLLTLQRKWRQYDELSAQMEEIIKTYGWQPCPGSPETNDWM